VQFPLPDQIDEQAVLAKIDPAKDVDGFMFIMPAAWRPVQMV
jgi:5,10-methylene-tetrahydrofolate dehydrogenase/methenyl tetrahydrofolate cyclohydrolase